MRRDTMICFFKYPVLPTTIFFFIPFCLGWGISRIFISGCITISNITITDINMVCGLLCMLIGGLMSIPVYGKLLKKYNISIEDILY